jgi:hypothetical protein
MVSIILTNSGSLNTEIFCVMTESPVRANLTTLFVDCPESVSERSRAHTKSSAGLLMAIPPLKRFVKW